VQPVTLVRPPFVVELYEAIETALHRVAAGEVPATKLDCQCSCRIVPWSRSTKPLVQAGRGCVRVCAISRWRQVSANAALNSEPSSVRMRRSGQPVDRHEDLADEARRGLGGELRQQAGHSVTSRRHCRR
jgi:hypothetical protein